MTRPNEYTHIVFLDWEDLIALPIDERYEIVVQRIIIHQKGVLAGRVWRAYVDREDKAIVGADIGKLAQYSLFIIYGE